MTDTSELDDLLAQLDTKDGSSSRVASVQISPSTRLTGIENLDSTASTRKPQPSYRLSEAHEVNIEDLTPQPPPRTSSMPPVQRAYTETVNIHPHSTAKTGSVGDVDEIDMIINGMAATYDTKGNDPIAGYCMACKTVIPSRETYFEALGNKYHGKCWTCIFCRKQLGGGNFYERQGGIYCDSCYRNNILPKCFRCSEPIATGEIVNADGKKYHTSCFTCPVCRQTILYYLFRDGQPFCEQHYYERYNPKCHVCSQALKETTVTALGREWHPHCFSCDHCRNQIGVGSFYAHHGKPVCQSCFQRVAAQQV